MDWRSSASSVRFYHHEYDDHAYEGAHSIPDPLDPPQDEVAVSLFGKAQPNRPARLRVQKASRDNQQHRPPQPPRRTKRAVRGYIQENARRQYRRETDCGVA